jgi:hypothetical protein
MKAVTRRGGFEKDWRRLGQSFFGGETWLSIVVAGSKGHHSVDGGTATSSSMGITPVTVVRTVAFLFYPLYMG